MAKRKLLTDKDIKAAKPEAGKRQYKLVDHGGLYLLVRQNKHAIGKYWRLAYRFGHKQKDLALGTYPQVSLKEARDKARDAKKLLEKNIDPSQQKKEDKQAAIQQQFQNEADSYTFEAVAREWYEHNLDGWSDNTEKTILSRLERYMFSRVGNIPINKVTKFQLADAIKAITKTGKNDTAKKVTQMTRNILQHAFSNGLIESIPLGETKALVKKKQKNHLPAIIDPKEVGALLRSIDAYQGTFVVCCALKLLPYVALRSGELREAKWAEFDFENALWTVPAMQLKQDKAKKLNPENFHLVPLSKQAIVILQELKGLTGLGNHAFPNVRGDHRPMSGNTINSALASMGYKDEMVGHGFVVVNKIWPRY